MADHAGDAQAAFGHHAVLVEVAAMEIGVGDDGAAGHFVEGDVLGGEVGRAGNDHRVAQPIRVLQRPAQRLHAAQAAAHHGRQRLDAQAVEQQRLRVDPVFHRDHRKVSTIDLAIGAIRIGVHRASRAKARAQVVDADNKKAVGVERLARPDHAVPPALGLGLPLVDAGHMVRGVQGVAHQHRVGALGVEVAVGFEAQVVGADGRATGQRQRLGEMH